MHVDGRDYWRCDTCEATFVPPAQRPTVADERAEYLLHRNDADDPAYLRFLSRLAAPLLQRLPPGAEGLDHGCGPGPALATMLRAAGHRVALYDPFFAPDTTALAHTYDFITSPRSSNISTTRRPSSRASTPCCARAAGSA